MKTLTLTQICLSMPTLLMSILDKTRKEYAKQEFIQTTSYILTLTGVTLIQIKEMAVISKQEPFMYKYGNNRKMVHLKGFLTTLVS